MSVNQIPEAQFPKFVFNYECSRQDRIKAQEAVISYRIGRRSYRWLGLLLGVVFMYAASAAPLTETTALLFVAGVITVLVLGAWPTYQLGTILFSTPRTDRVLIEINESWITYRCGNQEPIKNPWLAFLGMQPSKHGIAFIFGVAPTAVWLPARVFVDAQQQAEVALFVRDQVLNFRSLLNRT
jgi:hypothetical protein